MVDWVRASLLALALLAACREMTPPSAEPIEFVGEAASGPSVRLMRETRRGSRERFAVVAAGTEDLFGVAFRLSYDPLALALADARAGPSWPSGSIAIAKEVTPGSIWVVWSARGDSGGLGDGAILGYLELEHQPGRSTDVAFVEERSLAFGARGVLQREVRFFGGRLVSEVSR